ncbi:MAG: hypothetical protein AAFR97_08085 [Bacteroidota bacterium]
MEELETLVNNYDVEIAREEDGGLFIVRVLVFDTTMCEYEISDESLEAAIKRAAAEAVVTGL